MNIEYEVPKPQGRRAEVKQFYLDPIINDPKFTLNQHTVMRYFKQLPFYDRNCNNEILEMQGMEVSINTLKDLVGIEYSLAQDMYDRQDNPYFVISKSYRRSPTEVDLMAAYYVAAHNIPANEENGMPVEISKGSTFAMPDLNDVITTHIDASLYYLQKSITMIDKSIALESQHPPVTQPLPQADRETQEQFDRTFQAFDKLFLSSHLPSGQ